MNDDVLAGKDEKQIVTDTTWEYADLVKTWWPTVEEDKVCSGSGSGDTLALAFVVNETAFQVRVFVCARVRACACRSHFVCRPFVKSAICCRSRR